jgi:hypothetical protein
MQKGATPDMILNAIVKNNPNDRDLANIVRTVKGKSGDEITRYMFNFLKSTGKDPQSILKQNGIDANMLSQMG